jgi:hypothetical protein
VPAHLWADPGTWIALGISALFLVVAFVMHRVIRKVLQAPSPPLPPLPPGIDAPASSDPSSTSTPSHHE